MTAAASSPAEWEAKCRALLAETYTPEGVEIYMRARNAHLGDRPPASLVHLGFGAWVFAVIQRIEQLEQQS